MHRDPGQDVEISRFHHAALGSYADNLCEDALKQSRDLFGLNLALDGIADTLPRFISSELAGVANHDKEEALSRMDQAIEDLQRARDAIKHCPKKPSKPPKPLWHVKATSTTSGSRSSSTANASVSFTANASPAAPGATASLK